MSTPNAETLLPTLNPTLSFRPANLGVSVAGGGSKGRYKVSVGAGYALSVLPYSSPNSATQGYVRFRYRFKK